MSDYTPMTADVRFDYAGDSPAAAEEFDRWLADYGAAAARLARQQDDRRVGKALVVLYGVTGFNLLSVLANVLTVWAQGQP